MHSSHRLLVAVLAATVVSCTAQPTFCALSRTSTALTNFTPSISLSASGTSITITTIISHEQSSTQATTSSPNYLAGVKMIMPCSILSTPDFLVIPDSLNTGPATNSMSDEQGYGFTISTALQSPSPNCNILNITKTVSGAQFFSDGCAPYGGLTAGKFNYSAEAILERKQFTSVTFSSGTRINSGFRVVQDKYYVQVQYNQNVVSSPLAASATVKITAGPHPVDPPAQPPSSAPTGLAQNAPCDEEPPILSATCVRGAWFINSSLVVDAQLNLTSSIVLSGNLTFTSTGSLVVSLNGSLTNTISVKGCATLDGTATIIVDNSNAAQTYGEIVLASFDEGYCNGSPTRFATLNIRAGCRLAPLAELRYNPKSLSVILGSLDSTSCDQNVPGGLSVGAISGIAVAVVVLGVIAIAATVFLVKQKILPHFDAKRERQSEAMSSWKASSTS
eukprot:TRINITY_DN12619_c0_g1_i1.p1 TRINITY_DN12619_c0_g1~~TRINITY_DN12619_c0_g1_i1.p1  ORF type:complete len:448 (+),score=50.68 TRINITY_DN12619_c0_g1_i1:58-1401(+)